MNGWMVAPVLGLFFFFMWDGDNMRRVACVLSCAETKVERRGNFLTVLGGALNAANMIQYGTSMKHNVKATLGSGVRDDTRLH
jgi:hypothetical protein